MMLRMHVIGDYRLEIKYMNNWKLRINHLLEMIIKARYEYLPVRSCSVNPAADGKNIVVSLTSYGSRLRQVHICIKSLLNQSVRPNKIVLYISEDEVISGGKIPKNLRKLEKKGLEIIWKGIDDIKPHKKYFYAFQNYLDAIIVTVDDDAIYDKNLIHDLIESYKMFPECVSARRVHRILHDDHGRVMSYNDWDYECVDVLEPSNELLHTGVGGVLYPPSCLKNYCFTVKEIKDYCLNADDIMIKFMELKAGIKVKFVDGGKMNPIDIGRSWETGLTKQNVQKNQNDVYIKSMEEFTGIRL